MGELQLSGWNENGMHGCDWQGGNNYSRVKVNFLFLFGNFLLLIFFLIGASGNLLDAT